jgi:hypothetical protein
VQRRLKRTEAEVEDAIRRRLETAAAVISSCGRGSRRGRLEAAELGRASEQRRGSSPAEVKSRPI